MGLWPTFFWSIARRRLACAYVINGHLRRVTVQQSEEIHCTASET